MIFFKKNNAKKNSKKYLKFYKILFAEFPEFVADNKYDKEDYDNSYMLILEFKVFFVDTFKKMKKTNKEDIKELFIRICNFIEKYMQDEDINTLIATGFLENLINFAEDDYVEIKTYLGKKSLEYLKHFDEPEV